MTTQKQKASDWLNHRLHDAIGFALNWPTEWELIKHDLFKKVYKVRYMDGGWYHLDLTEDFVRSCMKWRWQKTWVKPTDYQDIFGRIADAAAKYEEK